MVGVKLDVSVRRELRCSRCGYGAVAAYLPDRCPMCRGETWLDLSRPALLDDLSPTRSVRRSGLARPARSA